MVTHNGGKKHQAARAVPVKTDRGNSLPQFKSKDVPQFAPNFSVYVLPPDAVCLYSEDRKLFLHGALYCALADRIGAGEPRGEIVRALAAKFPPAEIDEAFKRLESRRLVVPA